MATPPRTTETPALPSTILIVDDEPSMRDVLSRILQDEGFRVMVASNAAEAIEVAHDPDQIIDLVVVDMVMPGVKGDVVAAMVTTERPDVPILFLTGMVETPESLLRGVDFRWELLHKPVWPEKIVEKVRGMIGSEPGPTDVN